MPIFERSIVIEAPSEEVFAWHTRPGAFERLNPPWDPVTVLERVGGVADRGRVKIRVGVGPFKMSWTAQHTDFEPGRLFKDISIGGPFAKFEHTHVVEPHGPGKSVLIDRIDYELPLGAVGKWLGGGMVERKLNRAFAYRQEQTRLDVLEHHRYIALPRKTVAITGASGLIGRTLSALLTTGGHRVIQLVRRPGNGPDEAMWNPSTGECELEKIEGIDAVVHLAGENLAAGRWTTDRKKKIWDSRVDSTRKLRETLTKMKSPPKAFLCASAIGFYGSRADEVLDEQSLGGEGFLADLCREWEKAAGGGESMRVVNLRFGVVLSPIGGAMAKMLLPFRMGLGGIMGSGTQYWSWITLDDAVGLIHHAIMLDSVDGPLNVVSPEPVTNLGFTRTLGGVLKRPTVFPVPAGVLRLLLGEMADEALLASQRVVPTRAAMTGYAYRDDGLGRGLRRMLGM